MMYLPRFCGSMSDYGRGHFGVYIQSSRFKGFVITKIDLIEILAKEKDSIKPKVSFLSQDILF